MHTAHAAKQIMGRFWCMCMCVRSCALHHVLCAYVCMCVSMFVCVCDISTILSVYCSACMYSHDIMYIMTPPPPPLESMCAVFIHAYCWLRCLWHSSMVIILINVPGITLGWLHLYSLLRNIICNKDPTHQLGSQVPQIYPSYSQISRSKGAIWHTLCEGTQHWLSWQSARACPNQSTQ